MAQHRPTPRLPQHRGELSAALATLAGTPDDHSGVDDQLIAIGRLCAQRIAAVRYASVTVRHDGAYTTVAASNDIAVAVDEAQYAERAGPCLEAIDSATPLGVPDIAATMRWPGFRETAYRLGLHTSLSVPLFAGRGEPIAALNLYGHDSAMMSALTAAVWAAYDPAVPAGPDLPRLDAGGAELATGLTEAFAVRAVIQRALGVIARREGLPDRAYATLRLRAADAGTSLFDAATTVIRESDPDPRR
ncbi:GAF domain-containing protein [Actinoplanes teichomyceticus]|uniref:GAF domain-containing protein n=1 Tax=Actinoplanes teichomyceticus TaxID=1867 RepID=A0A561VCQ6_ACTTI|nr:GAF domain-containing protein [Actinoplanes teichomyceticus]TWG09377.1 GAF domain-containing protein [Actinoplanes teichomyceticus]GIF17041.1 transcriptional regulator [Actinoplanes teichomyceticus]